MEKVFGILLYSLALYVGALGFRTWLMGFKSRQNVCFLGICLSTFVWAGSHAILLMGVREHAAIFVTLSALGAIQFTSFLFLFMISFYWSGFAFLFACFFLPILSAFVNEVRYRSGAAVLVETSYGYAYKGLYSTANVIFYGYLAILAVIALFSLGRKLKNATIKREKICLTVWMLSIIIFGIIVLGTDVYRMIYDMPTSPVEGFLACGGAISFYAVTAYMDMLQIPKKKVQEYVTEYLRTPVVFVNREGNIVYCNESFKDFFHLTGKVEGTNQFYSNIITEHPLEEAIKLIYKTKQKQGVFKATTLDGERTLDIRYTVLFDRFGDTKCVINIINDITPLEKLMENLEQQTKIAEESRQSAIRANEAKSGFLANMSHEIRTPLNAILGMNEMVMREELTPQAREYAQNIDNAGQTLLSIINDILDFSKIESGKMEIVPVTYELATVLKDVVNMVTKKAQDKGLKLVTDVANDIPCRLFGDEVRIRQIILNIVNNAVKYTQEGSVTIRVSWRALDEIKMLLVIAVQDTGVGIKEDDLKKLFKGFQRVDMTNNRNIEGTGLGLAITKRLAEQMEGVIDVESEYGKGSCFTISLPQVIMDDRPMGNFMEEYRESAKRTEGEGIDFTAPDARILIVDDNRVNLVVAKGLLKNTGIKFDTVNSGQAALEKVKDNVYHIIFLDHMMPEMDGLETIKRMRELEENASKDAKVIALTANAISGSREMYLMNGFDDYLTKPINVVKYAELVKRYLPQELIHDNEKEK